MKKYDKLELIGFAILVIGFIFYILSPYIDINIISENEKIFQIAIFVGLIIQSFGMLKREKTQRNKEKNNK